MPHQKITQLVKQHMNAVAKQLVVSWNKIGWVQIAIYPEGWENTGDAWIIDLPPTELNRLINTLRRAKRQAYFKGNRHTGFEDRKTEDPGSLYQLDENAV